MSNSYDPLIYGKDSTERIVCIEPKDGYAEVFIENESGEIEVFHTPNSYWLLSNTPMGKTCQRLKGNLHYKYGKKFESRAEYYKAKTFYKNNSYDTFSIHDGKEALMVKDGYTYYKGMQPSDVSLLSFDIETTTLEHTKDAKLLLISNSYRKNGVTIKKLFAYDDYENEGEMLVAWCAWVREMNPSIVIGHNVFSFDIPYIDFIAQKYNVKLSLGRDESPLHIERKYESKKRIDGSRDQAYHKVKIYGREIVDTYFLALTYDIGRKYESYGLKKIVAQEGLELPSRTFYEASQIRFNYTNPNEWQKIKDYCIDDADDAISLFDLMIPTQFYWTQSISKSLQSINESATGSQLNSIMIRSYLQDGHSLPKASEAFAYPGAISWGNPGSYSNVKKWDVSSLYPSIMLQYKIYSKDKDPNGNFLKIVEFFTNQRLKDKEMAKTTGLKHYDDMQASRKIGINSAYGMLGATGLLFNYPEGAAEVTRYGREILCKAIEWATSKTYEEWNVQPNVSEL